MAVEMIIDQLNPHKRRYRTETFCYGPRSCSFYQVRTATKGSWSSWNELEEDWIDDDATLHRGPDE